MPKKPPLDPYRDHEEVMNIGDGKHYRARIPAGVSFDEVKSTFDMLEPVPVDKAGPSPRGLRHNPQTGKLEFIG